VLFGVRGEDRRVFIEILRRASGRQPSEVAA